MALTKKNPMRTSKEKEPPKGAMASAVAGATTLVGVGAALAIGGVVLAALAALAALILIPLGLIPLAFDPSEPAVPALAVTVLPTAASASDVLVFPEISTVDLVSSMQAASEDGASAEETLGVVSIIAVPLAVGALASFGLWKAYSTFLEG